MLSLRAAATLLEGAHDLESLASITSALGLGQPLPLDDAAASALGITSLVLPGAHIAPGPGTVRALLVVLHPSRDPRDALQRIAVSLARRVPHLLWLLVAVEPTRGAVALAAWSGERSRPRVAALLADRRAVVPSDAETLVALAATAGSASDVLTHARWLDVLGRDALTRRFYRTLERLVQQLAASADSSVPVADRADVALSYVSRLLFLSFLETRGWLDGDGRFLETRFTDCMLSGGRFHQRVLLPLFFGTLNTPRRRRAPAARALGRIPFLNGGLFAPTPVERRHARLRFSDDVLGALFGDLLSRYRFTAREESADWSEAAVDPEMLGRVFESLMSSHHRRESGAFFTPHALVASVTRAAFVDALRGDGVPRAIVERALTAEPIAAREGARLRARIDRVTVLDPACGSGAFLVHALEELSALAHRLGDARPLAAIRRTLLTRAIYGVDVNPTAVWLCQLRLWLSVVIESGETDPLAVEPLPNLDRNVRVGDALSGDAFDVAPRASTTSVAAPVARLRERYARASGARKRSVERALERAERALTLAHLDDALRRCAHRRRDLLAVLRSRDLFGARRTPTAAERAWLASERQQAAELRRARRRVRDGGALPFSFPTHFADAARSGGFDIIVGNPPWVRWQRIPAAARADVRHRFVVARSPVWERGAALANAGSGFPAQVDLAALFVERAVELLAPGGVLSLLLPVKLWCSLSSGGVRRLLHERTELLALEDWSESPAAFDAAVYPSLLAARRRAPAALLNAAPHTSPGAPYAAPYAVHHLPLDVVRPYHTAQVARGNGDDSPAVRAAVHHRGDTLRWSMPPGALPLDADPAAPWVVVPPDVADAFTALRNAGVPLAECGLGRPRLGVKCGCNDAFLITVRDAPDVIDAPSVIDTTNAARGDAEHGIVRVVAGGRSGVVERALLRPVLRGEHLLPWGSHRSSEHIVWTHDDSGAPLAALPPHATRWLARWRRQLAGRADARGSARWWMLFRTPAADARSPRVVWADMGREPRATILRAGDPTVPLNSCYVLSAPSEDDALALTAWLNTPLAAAWLRLVAEPARGGYRRYMAWSVALLPIPRDWHRARALLVPLARRAMSRERVGGVTLTEAAACAFGLSLAELDPLLAWGMR
ncbi:MAG TPA: DNA methyltransferase [Gemmatimonadaceae bacterium]|nr:DNA methyltransferase [Gemmatimonadaceae bacterium]